MQLFRLAEAGPTSPDPATNGALRPFLAPMWARRGPESYLEVSHKQETTEINKTGSYTAYRRRLLRAYFKSLLTAF